MGRARLAPHASARLALSPVRERSPAPEASTEAGAPLEVMKGGHVKSQKREHDQKWRFCGINVRLKHKDQAKRIARYVEEIDRAMRRARNAHDFWWNPTYAQARAGSGVP
jgi:hypothetical protein